MTSKPQKFRVLYVPTSGCCPSHLSEAYPDRHDAEAAVQRWMLRGEVKAYQIVTDPPSQTAEPGGDDE